MAVLRGAGANKEGELCVQAIFLLLDILKKWAEDNKGTTVLSAQGAVSLACMTQLKADWRRLAVSVCLVVAIGLVHASHFSTVGHTQKVGRGQQGLPCCLNQVQHLLPLPA